jgi:hypothetical protein
LKGSAEMVKKRGLIFLAGMAFSVVIFILLGVFGIIPPAAATILVKKWNILESDPYTLLIKCGDSSEISVGIERDSNGLSRIGVVVEQKSSHSSAPLTFTYLPKGNYGKPATMYGCADNTMVWRDWNADGIFDQLLDYQHKLMEIRIDNGKWVEGKGIDEVSTSEGVFIFDANIGKWQSANKIVSE